MGGVGVLKSADSEPNEARRDTDGFDVREKPDGDCYD